MNEMLDLLRAEPHSEQELLDKLVDKERGATELQTLIDSGRVVRLDENESILYCCESHEREKVESELRTELATLDEQLAQLKREGDSLKEHMDLLHEYNDQKDAAVMLLGKLATLRRCCVRDLYVEYELDEDD
jgi:DNA repair protein Swi5/Sae3